MLMLQRLRLSSRWRRRCTALVSTCFDAIPVAAAFYLLFHMTRLQGYRLNCRCKALQQFVLRDCPVVSIAWHDGAASALNVPHP